MKKKLKRKLPLIKEILAKKEEYKFLLKRTDDEMIEILNFWIKSHKKLRNKFQCVLKQNNEINFPNFCFKPLLQKHKIF